MKSTGNTQLDSLFEQWRGEIYCPISERLWHASELRDLVKQVELALGRSYSLPQKVVALAIQNSIAFPTLLFALLNQGANILLFHSCPTPEELGCYGAKFGIDYFITDQIGFCPQNSTVRPLDSLPISLLTVTTFHIVHGAPARDFSKRILLLTSGSTATESLCVRTMDSIGQDGLNYLQSLGDIMQGAIHLVAPLSHLFGLGFGLATTLLSHNRLVLSNGFNPKRIFNLEHRFSNSVLIILPSMVRGFLACKSSHAIHSLPREVFYAGSFCDPADRRDFEDAFQTHLNCIYGSTETGGISSTVNREGMRFPGVGLPLCGIQVQIPEYEYLHQGQPCGDVLVASTAAMEGYYPGREQNLAGGFWRTGDLGYFDASGYLHLSGRVRDVINVHGIKVHPQEVESVIVEFNGVVSAVVYPGDEGGPGECVYAAIRIETPVHIPDLKAHCLARLSRYKVPHRFFVMEQFPATPTGKIKKRELPHHFARTIIHTP